MALGTRTKFQFEILTTNVISGIVYIPEIILEMLVEQPTGPIYTWWMKLLIYSQTSIAMNG